MAAAWLTSELPDGPFGVALDHHRVADLARTAAAVPGTGLAALARQLAAHPDALNRLPGCGGLHLLTGEDDGAWLLAAELAAAGGPPVKAVLPSTGIVTFPLAGLTLTLQLPAAVTLAARLDQIDVMWPRGQARVTWTADGLKVTGDARADWAVRDLGHLPIERAWPYFGRCLEAVSTARIDSATPMPTLEAVLSRTLHLLRRADPALHSEMVGLPVWVVPLAPGERVRESLSVRHLPNVVFASLTDPFEALDLLCHEYFHLKLFFLEAETPLLTRPTAPVVSPWRRDLRSAQGLLHALYVFAGVARVFDRLFAVHAPSRRGQTRRALWWAAIAAGGRLLRAADARPTSVGAALADLIEAENALRLAALRQHDPDLIAWAERVVMEHVRQAGRPDSTEPGFLAF